MLNPKAKKFRFRDYLSRHKENIWILDRIILELVRRLDYVYCFDEIEEADINYYINWHAFKRKSQSIDVGFFTHFEDFQKDDFLNTARQVDYSVCMSKKYCDFLKDNGISNVSTIKTGIDTELFKPKLILGYAGGIYSKRKGIHLLERLRGLSWVELRLTEGKLLNSEHPNFYRQLDYVLIPSLVEGVPICLLEGLACGIPVIAPKDVGAVSEYSQGITHYRRGDFDSLVSVLKSLYEEKLKISRQLGNQTWENYAKEHDKLFGELILKNSKNKD